MILPSNYYSLNISLVDFVVFFFTQLIFFFFIRDKISSVKENIESILLSSLLSIGILSLLLSWQPFYLASNFRNIFLSSILLFFSGVFVQSLTFRKDFILSKNESFNLAFQLSMLGSLAYLFIKILFTPDYYGYPIYAFEDTTMVPKTTGVIGNVVSFSSNFGLLFILLGIVILIYHKKADSKLEHVSK